MKATLALGLCVWILALVGGWVIAGAVGVLVLAAFFVTAMVLGVLQQRDLDRNYIVIRKDGEER